MQRFNDFYEGWHLLVFASRHRASQADTLEELVNDGRLYEVSAVFPNTATAEIGIAFITNETPPYGPRPLLSEVARKILPEPFFDVRDPVVPVAADPPPPAYLSFPPVSAELKSRDTGLWKRFSTVRSRTEESSPEFLSPPQSSSPAQSARSWLQLFYKIPQQFTDTILTRQRRDDPEKGPCWLFLTKTHIHFYVGNPGGESDAPGADFKKIASCDISRMKTCRHTLANNLACDIHMDDNRVFSLTAACESDVDQLMVDLSFLSCDDEDDSH